MGWMRAAEAAISGAATTKQDSSPSSRWTQSPVAAQACTNQTEASASNRTTVAMYDTRLLKVFRLVTVSQSERLGSGNGSEMLTRCGPFASLSCR